MGKVVQHQLTVPEGLTSERDLSPACWRATFSRATLRTCRGKAAFCPTAITSTAVSLASTMIQRMRQAQDRLVREVWERRNPDLPLKTPDQTRHSRLHHRERDRPKPEERTRIAAVLTNRLKQKMKLQFGPDHHFGLVFGKGGARSSSYKSEIAQPTPYNTYVIDGLPPGPIANPGRGSIEAAANPARTKELFFAADGTGGHAFAETYDQHLKNVARLRALESEQRGEASAPDVQAPRARTRGRLRPAPAQRGKRGANSSSRAAGAAQ